MPDLVGRGRALALFFCAALACGDDGALPSGTSDDDDGATGTGTSGTGSSGASTTTPATSSTTEDPTGGPDWTTGEETSCINMDGEGPCYVQTLIPIPSVDLVYGDFDGDDAIDFAVHDDADGVLLFAGEGGTFAAGTAMAFDPNPMHDGDPVALAQLRVMETMSGPDRIFVQGTYGSLGDVAIDMWWTDGGGFTRFYTPTQSPPAGPWFGDFDGAGDVDLAFASMGNTLDPLDVHACDPGGCGDAEAQVVTGAPSPPWTILAGEVTGDARADLVAVSRTGTAGAYASHAVVLRATASGFETGAPIDLGPDLSASSSWLVELTGDAALDLLVASDAGDAADDGNARYLHLFPGDGAGGFATGDVLDAEMNVRGLAVADFDGDDFPDIVARRHDTEVLDVYTGDGSTFTLGPRYQIDQVPTGQQGEAVGPWATRVVDLDGNGVLDVLTVVQSDAEGLAVAVLLATKA
jgi:hypothetical protein